MDSSVVSIPLTAAGTEVGGRVPVVVTGEFDRVAEEVDTFLVVHPVKVITTVKTTAIINKLFFIVITPSKIMIKAIRQLNENQILFIPFVFIIHHVVTAEENTYFELFFIS
jgi:hypothetical protein